MKVLRYLCFVLIFLFITGFLSSAENRYALIIGVGNYRDRSIPSLSNPPNDAADVAAVLKELGYDVTLKTNIGLRDMINAVRDFTGNLRQNTDTEGFFWFAGHGLSIRGVHYLLPQDVDASDEAIIARGSYSVDELMEEIEATRNRTNLIVIDACRNNFLPGAGSSRSTVSRGLAVLSRDDYRIKGNKIVYSTMAGRTAADGLPGSRNSPFAQAFIANIKSPEIFDDVFLDIANETLRLTRGEQEPYSMGTFAVKSYSINLQQAAVRDITPIKPSETASPSTSVETARVNPNMPASRPASSDLNLDGRKVFSFQVAPAFYGTTFRDPGGSERAFSVNGNVRFNFYESYGNYGNFFFIPNSFFVSVDVYQSKLKYDISYNGYPISSDSVIVGDFSCEDRYLGAILGLGTSWKIRIDQSQRFMANFGLSFEFFLVSGKTSAESDNIDVYVFNGISYVYASSMPMSLSIKDSLIKPGIGLHGGIGFRFSRLISLDLSIIFKTPFGGFKDAKDFSLNNFGGTLGVTFWWPR